VRPAALITVVVLAAGCGSSSSGRAVVWVTQDRGGHVLHAAKVPAGLTAIQGLERVAKVETRYGGRYVRSVDGVRERGQRAWFYYVNGYLADRSGAEYRLHPGDVEWWDYRSWRDPAEDPVVVGSFPEPFVHGYDGKRLPAVVVALDPRNRFVRSIARRLRARTVVAGAGVPPGANVLYLGGGTTGVRFEVRLRREGEPPGSPVRMLYLGDLDRLARGGFPFQFRYRLRSS
jgi:Domain of unknown function (DUF4430)